MGEPGVIIDIADLGELYTCEGVMSMEFILEVARSIDLRAFISVVIYVPNNSIKRFTNNECTLTQGSIQNIGARFLVPRLQTMILRNYR